MLAGVVVAVVVVVVGFDNTVLLVWPSNLAFLFDCVYVMHGTVFLSNTLHSNNRNYLLTILNVYESCPIPLSFVFSFNALVLQHNRQRTNDDLP